MEQKETFIEYIASMISDEYFIKKSPEDKQELLDKLQWLFEQRIEGACNGAYHKGWMAGMENARKIFFKTEQ